METCCDSKDCDLAYMVGRKCYSVSCSSKEDCRPVSVKASKKTPLISAMVMKVEPKEETGNSFGYSTLFSAVNLERDVFLIYAEKKMSKFLNKPHIQLAGGPRSVLSCR